MSTILTLMTALAQPIGDFSGALQPAPGVELRIVFHLEEGGGTMDSIDQGALGIPLSSVKLDGEQFHIGVDSIGGSWEGVLDGDTLRGTWAQGPARFPLVLERTTASIPLDRPQTPKPPFPYSERELSVPVDASITLAGTLTLPAGKGPHPVLVFITGSGPQDRDESLMGHQPFRVLADHLARNGVGSYRYDDRGVAESTGDFSSATSFDFATDASAALQAVRGLDGVGAVGYLGHSEGGIVAPLAQRSAPADLLVLLAPPGVDGKQLILEQSARIAAVGHASPMQIGAARELNEAVYKALLEGADHSSLVKLLRPALGADAAEAQVSQLETPWFRTFLTYDPAPALSKLHVPVLALIGERDLQVPADQNLPVIRQALAGNSQAVVEQLPGLNHLLQPTETGAPTEYASIPTTIDPTALNTISDWVKQVTR